MIVYWEHELYYDNFILSYMDLHIKISNACICITLITCLFPESCLGTIIYNSAHEISGKLGDEISIHTN